MEEKEVQHTISILKEAKKALGSDNSFKLLELSNQKIHSAACVQDIESITLTIIIYSLGKLIERRSSLKIKNWNNFVRKLNSLADLAIKSLGQKNQDVYRDYILKARSQIESLSPSLKQYTREIIRNACINKASHIYKHGISMGQTAKLLGITEWELAEYTGQTRIADINYNKTLNEKKRAQIALEFFK